MGKIISSSRKTNQLIGGYGFGLIYCGYIFAWAYTSGTSQGSFLAIGFVIMLGMLLIATNTSPRMANDVTKSRIYLCIPLLIYFLISISASIYISDIVNVSWLLFGLAFYLLAILSNPEQLKINEALMGIGAISLLTFVILNIDAMSSHTGGRQRTSFDNQAYTMTAYGFACLFMAAFVRIFEKNVNRLFILALLAGFLYVIVNTGTRSVYIGLLLAVSCVLAFQPAYRKSASIILGAALLAPLALTLLGTFPTFSYKIDFIIYLIAEGANSLMMGSSSDASGLGRYLNRESAIRQIQATPLFGAGFKFRWIDFPLLQAFQDLGIFFGALYFLSMILVPVAGSVLLIRNGNLAQKTVAAIYLANVPRFFFHGQPYDWPFFTFLIPLYGMLLGLSSNKNAIEDPRRAFKYGDCPNVATPRYP